MSRDILAAFRAIGQLRALAQFTDEQVWQAVEAYRTPPVVGKLAGGGRGYERGYSRPSLCLTIHHWPSQPSRHSEYENCTPDRRLTRPAVSLGWRAWRESNPR